MRKEVGKSQTGLKLIKRPLRSLQKGRFFGDFLPKKFVWHVLINNKIYPSLDSSIIEDDLRKTILVFLFFWFFARTVDIIELIRFERCDLFRRPKSADCSL